MKAQSITIPKEKYEELCLLAEKFGLEVKDILLMFVKNNMNVARTMDEIKNPYPADADALADAWRTLKP